MTFVLLPAVDVADGVAVRLVQGAAGTETAYGDPAEAAAAWASQGAEWIHLVDLDAAFGRGSNAELLAGVVRSLDLKVELSGGIRDDESLKAALATGVDVSLANTAIRSPLRSTCAVTRFLHVAGLEMVAICGRRSTVLMPKDVRAMSSPT